MKRLSLILLAALPFLTTSAQVQIYMTHKDGNTTSINDFDWMEFNDSAQSISIYPYNTDSATILPMSQLEQISFGRDRLPWNLSWKSYSSNYHFAFGYSAITISRR